MIVDSGKFKWDNGKSPELTEAEQLETGVTPDYIRLSIGLEDIEDIMKDTDQALEKAAKA